MNDASAAILVGYVVQPWGLQGNADWTINDEPIPLRSSTTLPPAQGNNWNPGQQIVVSFATPFSPLDNARFTALNGTTATFTLPFQAAWIRCTGTIAYSSPTLTFTLTKQATLQPFNIADPYL